MFSTSSKSFGERAVTFKDLVTECLLKVYHVSKGPLISAGCMFESFVDARVFVSVSVVTFDIGEFLIIADGIVFDF